MTAISAHPPIRTPRGWYFLAALVSSLSLWAFIVTAPLLAFALLCLVIAVALAVRGVVDAKADALRREREDEEDAFRMVAESGRVFTVIDGGRND